jgi:hypothetical protein
MAGSNSAGQPMALLLDTSVQHPEKVVYNVYHYFATLPTTGLDTTRQRKLANGDSIMISGVPVWASNSDTVAFPVHVNPNSGSFIFNSNDSIDAHTFEIVAIDNNNLDSKMDSVRFNTTRVPPPVTTMVPGGGPDPNDTVYISDHVTDTFKGLIFTFQASDPNSPVILYSWSVDSIRWSAWSPNTQANVTLADLEDANGKYDTSRVHHTFAVRSENEFGSEDTLGYYVTQCDTCSKPDTIRGANTWGFNAIYPRFLRKGYVPRTLIINNSYEYGPVYKADVAHPDTAMLYAYYRTLLNSAGMQGRYDFWDVDDQYFPHRAVLANYDQIIFVADLVRDRGLFPWTYYDFPDTIHKNPIDQDPTNFGAENEDILLDWCYIGYINNGVRQGGKLIISSWNLVGGNNSASFPLDSLIIHGRVDPFLGVCFDSSGIHEVFGTDSTGDFDSAIGDGTTDLYPTVTVDPAKIDTARWGHGLPFMRTVLPIGFAEYLYDYNRNFGFNTAACPTFSTNIGTIYQGVTFSCIYFGFPLYYINSSDAIIVFQRAIQDAANTHL